MQPCTLIKTLQKLIILVYLYDGINCFLCQWFVDVPCMGVNWLITLKMESRENSYKHQYYFSKKIWMFETLYFGERLGGEIWKHFLLGLSILLVLCLSCTQSQKSPPPNVVFSNCTFSSHLPSRGPLGKFRNIVRWQFKGKTSTFPLFWSTLTKKKTLSLGSSV